MLNYIEHVSIKTRVKKIMIFRGDTVAYFAVTWIDRFVYFCSLNPGISEQCKI